VHQQLRGHDLGEQEQLLAPPEEPRTQRKPPTRSAPLPPVPRLPENQPIARRLAQAAQAAGMITRGVETAKDKHALRQRARDEEVSRIESAPKKKGLAALFAKKPKLPPPLPPMDHAGAAAAIERAREVLAHDSDRAQTLRQRLPEGLLPAAADTVERTADRIDAKVERPHVESVRDLAVGLRHGDDAMLARLLARGGDIAYETLSQVRSLGKNEQANVYEMRYLGMAPVAYKRSNQEGLVSESGDPTVREHDTMRSLSGDPHVLKAGGRTLDKRGFIMEYANKGDLAGLAKKLKAMPLAERVEIWKHLMRGGFEALDELHASGRSHGDVKNENLLLGDDLEPRLMDFGTTGKDHDAGDTGTATYMAPEVHDKGAKKTSDVWSMGESLLMGVFGMNSVDFERGRSEGSDQRFGEDVGKRDKLADGRWLTHVKDKVKGLPDADVLVDFIKKVMTLSPRKRLTARQALQHDFLKLAKGQKSRGKEALTQALA